MDITTIRPERLTARQLSTWRGLLAVQRGLDSPFFHPRYVQIIGEARNKVEVAILSENGRPVGFFPFERHHPHVGRPLGVKLCDFQGVVISPGACWSAEELLEGCGLRAWHFDHLLSEQSGFWAYHMRNTDSPFIDLTQGYDYYQRQRRREGGRSITATQRKRRKLEREVGPVRFQWHTEDRSAMRELIDWKRAQRKRTATFDVFAFDWVTALLQRLQLVATPDFAVVLSALFARGRIVALHFGMRTQTALHYWFAAYDRQFQKYSPGHILLLDLVGAAAERGIGRVDLGKGDEAYKQSFGSGSIPLAEGTVDARPLHTAMRRVNFRIRDWIKSSSLSRIGGSAKRLVNRRRHELAMR